MDGYYAFVEKWDHILRKNMTDAEILEAGYKKWKWGNTGVGQLMLETAIMGEYFHIYRSFWRSHMCAVDGKPQFLTCPESCGPEVPFEECICKVRHTPHPHPHHAQNTRLTSLALSPPCDAHTHTNPKHSLRSTRWSPERPTGRTCGRAC